MGTVSSEVTSTAALEDIVRIDIPGAATSTALPALGGVGWRAGVPHIIINMGDNPPACPFPIGEPPAEYIQPASSRGVPVPVAMIRHDARDFSGTTYFVPIRKTDDPDPPHVYWERTLASAPSHYIRYERSGFAGEFDVGPTNAATLPGTLAALADLDIAVVGVCPGFVLSDGNLPNVSGQVQGERTAAELRQLYDSGYTKRFTRINPGDDVYLPDPYGGVDDAPYSYSAMALLTGAVKPDGRAMAYQWGLEGYRDSRWATPTETNASEFVTFLLSEIVALAGRMGNANKFDIALCLDNTGSFEGANTTAQRIWLDLISRMRAEARDIWVAVSRYEDYAQITCPWAGDYPESRPFILQYPVSPVADDADYANMITALQTDTPGFGGDTPEATLEAFYQIATGNGFNGNGGFGPPAVPMGSQRTFGESTIYTRWPDGSQAGDAIVAYVLFEATTASVVRIDALTLRSTLRHGDYQQQIYTGYRGEEADLPGFTVVFDELTHATSILAAFPSDGEGAALGGLANGGGLTVIDDGSSVTRTQAASPTNLVVASAWVTHPYGTGVAARIASDPPAPSAGLNVQVYTTLFDEHHELRVDVFDISTPALITFTADEGLNAMSVLDAHFTPRSIVDTDVTDSGPALAVGVADGDYLDPVTGRPINEVWTPEQVDYFYATYQLPDLSQGLGYLAPGWSGDVPPFSVRGVERRGTGLVAGTNLRIVHYKDQGT